MKASDLKIIVKNSLKEIRLNEKATGKQCNCPPGSEPGDGTFQYGAYNCQEDKGCEACCKVIQDALDKGKGGDEMTIPMYNAGGLGGKDLPDEPKGGEAPQGKTMGENNLQERFQKLAGIITEEKEDKKEGHCAEGQYMSSEGHCMEMKMYDEDEDEMINEELFTALGALVGVIGAALGAGHLQDIAEDPAMAEKYPKLKDVFSMLSTIGKDMGKGIKEGDADNENLNEGIFTAIGGLIGLLGAAGVTTAIEMALEDPAVAEKYPKMVKVFELLRKVGGAAAKGIK